MSAAKTVTGVVHDPLGTARAGAVVVAHLSHPALVNGSTPVPPLVSATTDSGGAYSLALWSSDDMVPPTAFYTISETIHETAYWSRVRHYDVRVPATAGPFLMSALPAPDQTISAPARLLVVGTPVQVAGALVTEPSAAGEAGLSVPHGVAPTAPADGDVWTTTAGLFVRVNGVTKAVTLT